MLCNCLKEIIRNMSPFPEHVAAPFQGFEIIERILGENNYQAARLIQILQAIQEEYRYLPKEALSYLIDILDIPAARVFGVVSFYSHFSLKPRGKYIVRLCDGTACHIKRSNPILEILYEKLGLHDEKTTSDDMLFTVETVNCLGACSLAPVMLINDEVHGLLTPGSAVALIDEILAKETNV